MNARVECGQMSSAEFVDDPLRSTVECDTAGVSALERFEIKEPSRLRNDKSAVVGAWLAG